MNKLTKAAFLLPIATIAIPISVAANEQEFIEFNKGEETIHLYNDIRTITFSKPVDSNSLQGITTLLETNQQILEHFTVY